jgi:all-trans-retinol dehydrogenase (NAD+)
LRVEGGCPRNGFGGHILLIGTGAAFIPLPGNATYNSSKAGVVSFHHTLGWELDVWHKAKNVRNSVFCPLMIDSAMTQGRMKEQKNQFLFPTLTVDQAASKIVKVLEQDRSQMFFAPKASYVSSILVMNSPTWIVRPLMKLLKSHETFTDYAAKTRYAAPEH